MLFLLHIANKNRWDKALKEGLYEHTSLDTEGFIHCISPNNLKKIISDKYKDKKDLEILVIDPEKLESIVKFEDTEKGTICPHIYGPINTEAVIKTIDFSTDKKGEFVIPDIIEKQLKK